MHYEFNITGETPSKKNSRIINTKTGRSFPSKKYTDWNRAAQIQLKPQKDAQKLKDPINTPVEITLIFTHGDKRRRDSDNGASSIFDLLTDSLILFDDNYNIVVKHTVINAYEKNNANCKIIINDFIKVSS